MTAVVVHKLDASGREVWTYHGRLLGQADGVVRLEAIFDRDEADLAGEVIRRGDRSVETFYLDRWYNVFEIRDAESGRLKAWYCNLCRPARMAGGDVYAEDLALDLVVFPDGRQEILDAEEYEALDLSRDERAQVGRALSELRQLAKRRLPPFDVVPD